MSSQAAPPKKPNYVLQFGTACLGGVLAWCIVHPFNTVAVRMNLATVSDPSTASKGFIQYTTELVEREGVLSLYKGLSAGIVRQIFYATSRFGLFEVFRDTLAKYRETDFASRLLVGVLSGGCAALISCPAEVTLVRMSNDNSLPKELRRNYKSIVDAAARMIKEEGVASFWRGSMPFVNRAMLVGAFQIGTYDQFKSTFKNMGLPDGFWNQAASSMAAGFIYSLVTMPFETAKNRMAFQKKQADGTLPYRTTIQTITTVAKVDGTLALWSGFWPYYGRCGGHTVSMFLIVEQLRALYETLKK
jgi:solute carrier family 25 oxoglutarate transporter 11